jgi:C4-type Zn-finger protein
MFSNLLVFTLIFIGGILFFLLGYFLFCHLREDFSLGGWKKKEEKPVFDDNIASTPRTCPVCSSILNRGEHVTSSSFPFLGNIDRLIHVKGCLHCLEGGKTRSCPECKTTLEASEVLIARIIYKSEISQFQVLGCSRCRGPDSWKKKKREKAATAELD